MLKESELRAKDLPQAERDEIVVEALVDVENKLTGMDEKLDEIIEKLNDFSLGGSGYSTFSIRES